MPGAAFRYALGELGEREIRGEEDNPRIVEYHDYTTLDANNDETAWCSAFVNWACAKGAGCANARSWLEFNLPGAGKANARSWLQYGVRALEPERGDIVVLWRVRPDAWQGHVGFVCEPQDGLGNVLILGGNQGNSVSIKPYPLSRVLQYRRG